ncbi:hypothetical protein FQN54_006783 [Arachnomyces sp. PD_36]|nr:hypothetical protein FQN54_006783 [Arachnomyces sp. PD_36]
MSFPPPPGLSQSSQSHSSLPPRPPPSSTISAAPAGRGRGEAKAPGTSYNAFTAFQPRAVAASQPYHAPSTTGPSPVGPPAGFSTPTTTYSSGYQYPAQYQQGASYYGQQQNQQYGDNSYGQSNAPQIRNPFPLPGQEPNGGAYGGRGRGFDNAHDQETEAQIAQWQSAYMSKDTENTAPTGNRAGGRRDGMSSATGANTGPLGSSARPHDSSAPSSAGPTASSTPVPGATDSTNPSASQKTVIRSGGGQTWTDPSLLEWDPAHFRLFAGNLAGEVTDESLIKAFSKYPSVQKARVVRDKRTEKSKGYGFVSFSDGEDYFKAAREMQGKYIGSHPVLLRRATTEIRPVANAKAARGGKKGGKGGKGGGGGGSGGGKGAGGGAGGASGAGAGAGANDKVISGGVQKKQGKTKGGLRVLG